MAAHQGIYKLKKPEKYRGDPNNVVYRSSWERRCFVWAERNDDVVQWSSEEVVIPYFYDIDKKYHRYFTDLLLKMKDGRTIIVEIKPAKEVSPPVKPSRKTKRYITESLTYVKNQNKWEAAASYCKDRGWAFEIWTENTLQQFGILPKPIKKLKSMPKLKAIKTKPVKR